MSWFNIIKDIRDIPIKFGRGIPFSGTYNHARDEIDMNVEYMLNELGELDVDSFAEILGHEYIHAVQYDVEPTLRDFSAKYEEFVGNFDNIILGMLNDLRSKFMRLSNKTYDKRGHVEPQRWELSPKLSQLQAYVDDEEIENIIYDEIEEFHKAYWDLLKKFKPEIIKEFTMLIEKSLLLEISAHEDEIQQEKAFLSSIQGSVSGKADSIYEGLRSIEVDRFKLILHWLERLSSLLTSGWSSVLQVDSTIMGRVGIIQTLKDSVDDEFESAMQLIIIEELENKFDSIFAKFYAKNRQTYKLSKSRFEAGSATYVATAWAFNDDITRNEVMELITHLVRDNQYSPIEKIRGEIAGQLSKILPQHRGFMMELVDEHKAGLTDIDWIEVARHFDEYIKEDMEAYR